MGLAERSFGGLHQRYTVLRVALGHPQTAYLRAEGFGDCQPGRIIRRTVDPQPAREPFERLVQAGSRPVKLPSCVYGRYVGVDSETHSYSSLKGRDQVSVPGSRHTEPRTKSSPCVSCSHHTSPIASSRISVFARCSSTSCPFRTGAAARMLWTRAGMSHSCRTNVSRTGTHHLL